MTIDMIFFYYHKYINVWGILPFIMTIMFETNIRNQVQAHTNIHTQVHPLTHNYTDAT